MFLEEGMEDVRPGLREDELFGPGLCVEEADVLARPSDNDELLVLKIREVH